MDIDVHDGIGRALTIAAIGFAEHVREAAERGAEDMVAYAQYNAPWTDRTGMAREGLSAEVSVEGTDVVIELFHTVEYGIWLETIQEGEFAIILPTLEALGPQILEHMGAAALQVEGSDF